MLSPGRSKRVQMQGGKPGTHPSGWVQARGVLCLYVAARRERATPIGTMGTRQMDLFQRPGQAANVSGVRWLRSAARL